MIEDIYLDILNALTYHREFTNKKPDKIILSSIGYDKLVEEFRCDNITMLKGIAISVEPKLKSNFIFASFKSNDKSKWRCKYDKDFYEPEAWKEYHDKTKAFIQELLDEKDKEIERLKNYFKNGT